MARKIYTGGSEYFLNNNVAGNIPQYGKPFPNHAGFAPRVDSGYDIEAVRPPRRGVPDYQAEKNEELYQEKRDEIMRQANGVLHDGEWYVKFFINSVAIDFGLSGTTGQSKYTRDFYPHNVIMPALVVSAQAYNQEDYGTIVEFVHQAQQKAVASTVLTQLEVGEGGLDLTEEGKKIVTNPSMKGVHKSLIAQGYVPQMPRKYQQGEYVPSFTLTFVGVQFFGGIFDSVSAQEPEQRTWAQIIEGVKATGVKFVKAEPPKPASETKSLPLSPHGGSPYAPSEFEKLTGQVEP